MPYENLAISQIREARRVFASRQTRVSSGGNSHLYKTKEEEPLHDQVRGYTSKKMSWSRQSIIGLLLVTCLLAFEVFNFDTTQYALLSLLGDVNFFGFRWATSLAVAFGAIDLAGLAYLLAPEREEGSPKEVWYLMGAWLLGATMNALMTWWAVSLALLTHDLGNEVLGRSQLIEMVPVFVAVLVWLTRILFIGAFSIAGSQIFGINRSQEGTSLNVTPARPSRARVGKVVQARQPSMASNRSGTIKSPDSIAEEYEPSPTLEQAERVRNTQDGRRISSIRQDQRPATRWPLPMTATGRVRRRRIVT